MNLQRRNIMTQINIYAMDKIVDHLAAGKTFAQALNRVYTTRNVVIPYNETDLCVLLETLGMSSRTTNALRRHHMSTLNDIVNYVECQKINTVPSLGIIAIKEIMETILNYCWDHMSEKQKTAFLIDTVERNRAHLREDFLDM